MKKVLVCLAILLAVGCSSEINKGVVTSKEHQGARTQTTMILVGKVMVPQIIRLPERWTLNITDSGKTGYCNVNKERFDQVLIGDYIECD